MAKILVGVVPLLMRFSPWQAWTQVADKTNLGPRNDTIGTEKERWTIPNADTVSRFITGTNLAGYSAISSPWSINGTQYDQGSNVLIEYAFGNGIVSKINQRSHETKFRGVRRWAKAGEPYGKAEALTAANVQLKEIIAEVMASQKNINSWLGSGNPSVTPRVNPTIAELGIGSFLPQGLNLSSEVVLVTDVDSAFIKQMVLWGTKQLTGSNRLECVVESATIGEVTTQAYVGTGAGDAIASTEQFYVADGSVRMKVNSVIEMQYQVGIYYDDTTRQLTISPVVKDATAQAELTALAAIQKEYDSNLFLIAKKREAGFDVKATTDRPIFTATSTLISEQFEAWWKSYLATAATVNATKLGDPGTAFDTWKLSNPNGSLKEYEAWLDKTVKATALTARSSSTPSAWSDLWSTLKDGANKAYDYVKQWPPTTWVAGYAGYKAVQAVEGAGKNKLLIYGAIGAAALLILK